MEHTKKSGVRSQKSEGRMSRGGRLRDTSAGLISLAGVRAAGAERSPSDFYLLTFDFWGK